MRAETPTVVEIPEIAPGVPHICMHCGRIGALGGDCAKSEDGVHHVSLLPDAVRLEWDGSEYVMKPSGLEQLRAELGTLRNAGSELTTALWALVVAQEPSMADGLPSALEHAEEVVKKYTSEESREQLSFALQRARSGGLRAKASRSVLRGGSA